MRILNSRMKAIWLARACAVAALVAAPWAVAQSSGGGAPQAQPSKPASSVPRPEDLEPGVNTSATPTPGGDTASAVPTPEPTHKSSPAGKPRARSATPSTSATPGTTSPQAGSAPDSNATSVAPVVAGAAPGAAPGGPGAAPPAPGAAVQPRPGTAQGKAHDRLELDTTQITGNRELPKVLYIVPWKHSDLGDLVGKPVNSLLDEVLTPVDRDVFRRENRYYDALKPDAGKQASGGQAGPH